MPAPDVSAIVAAYRAEDTVGRAVASALASRGVTVEVIVGDDASPDGTAAAAEVAGARVVRLDANAGPGGARNAALDSATGRYVAVLDADDTVAPDRLARLVARADAEDADIVLDNLLVNGAPFFPPGIPSRIGLAAFIRGNHPFGRGPALGYAKPVLRRAFVERHDLRYDPALRIGEDYLLLADALALGARAITDPRPGYHYTRRADSISARLAHHHLEAMVMADARFAARHRLPADAAAALAGRAAALRTATAFLAAIDSLKARQPAAAAAIVARRPHALWHFRLPLMARIARLRAA